MDERLRDGFVRECHGDLHLRNVALVDGEPTLFDCIEFDPRLRWSDVMADVAFTAMDLRARGRTDFARRLLNRYLEATGDYGGVAVLRFYIVNRAIVRAKVAYLRAAQAIGQADGDLHWQKGMAYLELAERLTRRGPRTIIVMHGFAGCGKTTLSQALVEDADLVRIRMDVERKRMEGLAVTARTGSGLDAGLYALDRSTITLPR
jgi:AAA+ superfamily predicted ATPase